MVAHRQPMQSVIFAASLHLQFNSTNQLDWNAMYYWFLHPAQEARCVECGEFPSDVCILECNHLSCLSCVPPGNLRACLLACLPVASWSLLLRRHVLVMPDGKLQPILVDHRA